MTAPDRQLLGKWATALARVRIYQVPDGLEIETNEHFEVSNTRVFFDDVQLVTLHRERGTLYLALTGVFSFGFLALVAFLATLPNEAWVVGIVFGIMGLPFLIAFLTRAIWGIDVVTIFGRRSKASLRFRFRKQRAREVYGRICAAVRAAQRTAIIPRESAERPLPDSLPPLPPAQ